PRAKNELLSALHTSPGFIQIEILGNMASGTELLLANVTSDRTLRQLGLEAWIIGVIGPQFAIATRLGNFHQRDLAINWMVLGLLLQKTTPLFVGLTLRISCGVRESAVLAVPERAARRQPNALVGQHLHCRIR